MKKLKRVPFQKPKEGT